MLEKKVVGCLISHMPWLLAVFNNNFKIAYLRVICNKKATITLPITFTTASTCLTHRGGGLNDKAEAAMIWATDSTATSTIKILTVSGPYVASMICIGY